MEPMIHDDTFGKASSSLYHALCTIPWQYLTVLKDEAGFFADACHADCSPPSAIASVKGQLLDMDEAFLLLARQQLQPSKVVTTRLLRSRQPLKELLLCDLAHAQQQKIAKEKNLQVKLQVFYLDLKNLTALIWPRSHQIFPNVPATKWRPRALSNLSNVSHKQGLDGMMA